MAADYDRLFQSPEGMEIPDDAAAQTDFDVDALAAIPPVPPSPATPNGHTPPPMPIDLAEHASAAPTKSPPPVVRAQPSPPARPPMPIDLAEHSPPAPTEATPPPVDRAQPRPPARPPMPIERTGQPDPPGPPPVQRRQPPPPAPPEAPLVDRPLPSPPVGPESPAPQPEPPRSAAPAQHSRHARRANRDDTNLRDLPSAGPTRHSHRADNPHGRTKAVIAPSASPSSPANQAAPKPNGGPVPSPMRPRERDAAPAGPARPPAQRPAESPARPDSPPDAATGARGTKDAVTHIGVQAAKKSADKAVPQRGWRRWVYALTRINMGLSRDEKYELDLHRRIRRNPRGSHQIAVVGLKGGVGKTTLTVALGSVLAQVRGDRILAFDADADSGNLADRAGHQSGSTVANLLVDNSLSHYNDVRAHTSVNAVNLEVLAAAEYSTAPRAFSDADCQYAADAVSRFYSVVLADCGAGLTRGVLATASGVVIVTSASIDGARQAAVAIDWLRNNGHRELLSRACVVLNHVVPGEPNVAITDLVRQFGQHVRPDRVVVLPWDKHLAAGKEIEIGLLDPVYKRRITELAAALSDDFDRGECR